ncbi:hypothetical protein P7K49_014874 [Saguinus oedipus]|uniref:Uncharacterized protein n=1 Tax=Saguinus oedipus TaxID=9490 RepID=A0ABQ9V8G8_SAGOE|nr:hypothetical protein P7K49_014874 [Saguinus oedipus]
MHSNKKMHHQQVESAIAIITGVVITSPPPSHHSVMACFLDNGLNGFSLNKSKTQNQRNLKAEMREAETQSAAETQNAAETHRNTQPNSPVDRLTKNGICHFNNDEYRTICLPGQFLLHHTLRKNPTHITGIIPAEELQKSPHPLPSPDRAMAVPAQTYFPSSPDKTRHSWGSPWDPLHALPLVPM